MINLQPALQARSGLFDRDHRTAFRLLNGFLEGYPALVVDIFGCTIVLYNYARQPQAAQSLVNAAREAILQAFPWVNAIVLKERFSKNVSARHGKIIYGEKPSRWIYEQDIRYAIDLLAALDSTFYFDTRHLRDWIYRNSTGKRILNTFAYTGSLGVAARAGGASQVVHIDRSEKFLNIARESYNLNGYHVDPRDFIGNDFFSITGDFRRMKEKYDIVLLDPPFFSVTSQGRVDLNRETLRLINKVRPLVASGGYLAVVNNALFVSGKAFISQLEAACSDGYLSIETLIPIPPDVTGFPETRTGSLPTDPAPFNHSTKIAILRFR